MGFARRAMRSVSSCFLYVLLLSVSKIWASSHLTYDPAYRHAGPVLIFLEGPLSNCVYAHRATRLAGNAIDRVGHLLWTSFQSGSLK